VPENDNSSNSGNDEVLVVVFVVGGILAAISALLARIYSSLDRIWIFHDYFHLWQVNRGLAIVILIIVIALFLLLIGLFVWFVIVKPILRAYRSSVRFIHAKRAGFGDPHKQELLVKVLQVLRERAVEGSMDGTLSAWQLTERLQIKQRWFLDRLFKVPAPAVLRALLYLGDETFVEKEIVGTGESQRIRYRITSLGLEFLKDPEHFRRPNTSLRPFTAYYINNFKGYIRQLQAGGEGNEQYDEAPLTEVNNPDNNQSSFIVRALQMGVSKDRALSRYQKEDASENLSKLALELGKPVNQQDEARLTYLAEHLAATVLTSTNLSHLTQALLATFIHEDPPS